MVSETRQSETQQLWAAFGERLRAFIRRRVESDADADDILQEVFLRIHRHADTVKHHDRLVSWLDSIAARAPTQPPVVAPSVSRAVRAVRSVRRVRALRGAVAAAGAR